MAIQACWVRGGHGVNKRWHVGLKKGGAEIALGPVRQHGHHSIVAVIYVKGGKNIGARRGPDQQPFFSGESAGGSNRFFVRHGEYHIYQVHIQDIRHKAIADALNP